MDKTERKKAMNEWLARKDITRRTIAEAVGVSACRVSLYLGAQTMTRPMWQRFVDAGVPAEFLPEPRDYKPRGQRRHMGTLEPPASVPSV